MYDVIVIGGGAAGMMAAGRAAETGKRVLLLEKNKNLGEKLKITGGGRCNITNAEENERILLPNYGSAEGFLYSSFAQFGVKETFNFFESRGLPLKVEAGKRAFPKTEKAGDVFRVLEKYLEDGGVEVRTKVAVKKIVSDINRIESVETQNFVSLPGEILSAKSYILATGGKSHPETGSTGDGFIWLKKLGHTVTEPTPTIVPLAVKEAWVKSLAGVTADEAKIIFYVNDEKKLVLKGKILFTHFGLSGPLILNAAGKVADLLEEGEVKAVIDLYPALDAGALDRLMVSLFDDNKNKELKNIFRTLASQGLAVVILDLCPTIDPSTKVNSLAKENRKKLGQLLKNLPMTISGLMGFDRAVVADGGLAIKEIEAKTMRSKLYENLFVTGDLLDIRRPSGGYSLQLCWTTGFVAGNNA